MSKFFTEDFFKFTLGFLGIITASLILVFSLQAMQDEPTQPAAGSIATSSTTTIDR